MYATTSSPEQILHNNIIVSQALNVLCLNIDIQVNMKLERYFTLQDQLLNLAYFRKSYFHKKEVKISVT